MKKYEKSPKIKSMKSLELSIFELIKNIIMMLKLLLIVWIEIYSPNDMTVKQELY